MQKPRHIAISLDDIFDWCSKNNISLEEGCKNCFRNLGKLIEIQVNFKIPIITVYLLPENADKSKNDYLVFSDYIGDFFGALLTNSIINSRKIKISIFGKWYNLPGKAIESLKNIIELSKDYDAFFVNFCVNYGGQEEIVDACKLIAKQVELGKIDSDMITKEIIKENVYSSYFLPPDVILVYGSRKLSGLLLWDSANSNIVFTDKPFAEFEETDITNLNHNLFK